MRAAAASILVLVLALALALAAAPARADAVEDAARVHLDRGVAAFRAGDYAIAHRELTAASELVPDKPNPYRWLALTEIQLGDCRRALVNIDGFVARVPAGDPRIAELVRLRELCQRADPLRVEALPPGAARRGGGALGDPAPPPSARPLTRRWWFWAAIGGAALTTTAAIVYAASGRDPTRLPPIECDLSGCRPGAP